MSRVDAKAVQHLIHERNPGEGRAGVATETFPEFRPHERMGGKDRGATAEQVSVQQRQPVGIVDWEALN